MIQSEPLKQRCFEQYLLNILGFSVKLKFVALAYVSAQTQVKRFALKKIKKLIFLHFLCSFLTCLHLHNHLHNVPTEVVLSRSHSPNMVLFYVFKDTLHPMAPIGFATKNKQETRKENN